MERNSGVRAVTSQTLHRSKDDDVPSLAAGVAFKIFLSLFPAMIAAVAVWSLVASPSDLERLLVSLEGLVPAEVVELLRRPLTDLVGQPGGAAGGVAAAGVLGGLWAATSAAATLIKALNKAEDVEERRKAVALRLVALAITVALFVAMVAVVVLLVVGPQIQAALLPAGLEGTGVATLISAGRLVGAILVVTALFGFVYWMGPNRPRPSLRAVAPGAVVGVLGWLALSGGFALYARTAGQYQATYGALAGVIVTMLWLQLSMLVLLFGAEINASLMALRERRRRAVNGAGFADVAPVPSASVPRAQPVPRGPAVRQGPAVRRGPGMPRGPGVPQAPGAPAAPTGRDRTAVGLGAGLVTAVIAVASRLRRGRAGAE